MSMFKKLKSIFIEEEVGTGRKTTTKSAKPKPASTKSSTKKPSITIDKSKAKGAKPADKFINLLLKAIEANNVDGFDYLEFKQSLQSIAKIETDEAKQYQNAFAMAQTMGLTKKTLFDSAERYVKVLANEESKFTQAVDNQKKAKVTEREEMMVGLAQSVKSKEATIKKLQTEIAAERKKLANIEGEVEKSLEKVEATQNQFYASYNLVQSQITADIEKIQQFIS